MSRNRRIKAFGLIRPTGWQLDTAVRAYQVETGTFAEVEQTRLEIWRRRGFSRDGFPHG